ncbi:syndetin-like isoform X2 [Cucurbita pepo subsp. pepo]|nr:syndetin-like isoform X2 [Cucurbita pepo subsp. pepo]XP_023519397.1 syndetin-like isoform X2 [Cucurbita pepo subsp. pepo]
MEHHEVMVKGMHLFRELEKDLKIANVICRNGKRHLNSSMLAVSRDLIVNSNSKKKQALLDMLPILSELRHAVDMQSMLEILVEEGNYSKAFQVLSEYLQLLDSFSELSVIREMSCGIETWLGRTLQKLDSLLIEVCQEFKKEAYLTVVDAYALIGDVSGLAEKIQSFFMQEVISETHSALKDIVQEDQDVHIQNSRLTYSDLCFRIPESKFRLCLLKTLAVLFTLMCSYYQIFSFQLDTKDSIDQTPNMKQQEDNYDINLRDTPESTINVSSVGTAAITNSDGGDLNRGSPTDSSTVSTSGSPWYHLRKDAINFVSQTLQRSRKNLWQLSTSRVSVLLSSAAVCSTSIHQFLKNYEDLNVFILAGEAFCGVEAVEFRQKLKIVCENYYVAFHKQSMHALKMVMEKENWLTLPPDTVQVVSFSGLVGDGAPLFVHCDGNSSKGKAPRSDKSTSSVSTGMDRSGFLRWLKNGNPFLLKQMHTCKEGIPNGELDGSAGEGFDRSNSSPMKYTDKLSNGANTVPEDESEDLLADFIDEDSQLPSRILKPRLSLNHSSNHNNDEITAQTGSSLCLLRSMDKYARLMQKLEIVNVEFFKGMCQLFAVFFYFVYETFGQLNTTSGGKGFPDSLNYKLKTALSRAAQDCDQWRRPHSSSPSASNSTFAFNEVTPSPPGSSLGYFHGTSLGLKERCAGADSLSLVARIMHRSKAHIQSMLLQTNVAVIEDFYVHLLDAVPYLIEHIHKNTARLLLHVNGYVDRIANAKWEVKELGLEHNGYVDLLLGEFKHYKTRLAHSGVRKEVQDLLLEYGLDIVAETLIEGISRVKRCSDEGRALMSLDLQVLINGLQHFVSENVKPKLQMVETFIKAYYLPETEYVHWARAHPEYSKSQVIGLVNLVASMKGWKRKTRLEILEKIE